MAAVAADRDLLFGLLAPQDGQIDRGQLVAAFRAWTRDRDRPLAERLAGRGDLDPDGRAAVVVPASRHLKEHGGDPGRGLAAIPFGPSTRGVARGAGRRRDRADLRPRRALFWDTIDIRRAR